MSLLSKIVISYLLIYELTNLQLDAVLHVTKILKDRLLKV